MTKEKVTINQLIEQGEELKGTFTKEVMGHTLTIDYQKVSAWITMCMQILETELSQGVNNKLYKEFEKWIGNLGNLNKSNFEQLVGILKGIKATSTDDEEETVFY